MSIPIAHRPRASLASVTHALASRARCAAAAAALLLPFQAGAAPIEAASFINLANQAAYSVAGDCAAEGVPVAVTVGTVPANPTCTALRYDTGPLDVSGLADGPVSIDVDDTVGTANLMVTKDALAPSVAFDAASAINASNAGAYAISGTCSENGRDVTITVTDTGSGNFSAPIACGAVTPGTFSAVGDLSGFAEGTITFGAVHADAAGNSANASTTADKDTGLPSVAFAAAAQINAANAGAYAISGTCSENGRDVTVTVTDSGAGIVSAPFACGAVTPGTFTAAGDLTSLADGLITFAAVHADLAGNSANAGTTAGKDTVLPSVAINPLVPVTAANAAAYSMSGTCSENGRNVDLTLSVGGSPVFNAPLVCGAVTPGTFGATGDLSGFPEGAIEFGVTHADAAGNAASANTVATKDTIALAPAITSPASGAGVAANPGVSGTGETGATVTVSEGMATVCTAPVTAGAWSCTTTLGTGSHTLAATQVDAVGNASPASPDVTFTVLAAQTITFDALPPRTFGDAPFEVSATASSTLAVAFSSLTTGVCTVSGSTVTIIAVGGCTIAADQAGDATYLPAPQVTQSFSVAQGTQTITFGAIADRTIGAPPFVVTATASSGLEVSFSSLTEPVCTVSGSLVTMIATGTCTIAADQAGNANVAAAPRATQSFQVLCDTGAPGDCDSDGIPNDVEGSLGRDPLVKDNDIFSPGAASARLFAMQQYRDFLGREGDAPGIQGWTDLVDGGTYSRTQVIDAFLQSPEFGGFVAPVVRLYFATFLRVPDYAGLTANAALVRSGTTTLQQLADFFTASPEFAATYGSLDDTQFVTLLYGNVLGRAPDQAGLDGWVTLLAGGMSRGQVLLGFSDSAEYQAAIANEVFVTMMYAGMLRRTPEAAGFSGWVTFLDDATYTRDQVISGFFLSSEYRARFLP